MPRFQFPNADPAVVWSGRPFHTVHRAIEPRHVLRKAHAVSVFDLRNHLFVRGRTDSTFWGDRPECFRELLPRVHSVWLTTIIQTRVAPRGMLSTQCIQYPRFALGGPIESLGQELGWHSSCGPNLDVLRGAARVSGIRAHASSSRSTGLRTADGPRFRTWV